MQDVVGARAAQGDEYSLAAQQSSQQQGAIQLRVLWGDNPIFVEQLQNKTEFWVGESAPNREPDFVIPSEQLGRDSLALITFDATGTYLNLPQEADGVVEFSGEERCELQRVRATLPASPHVAGGTQLSLTVGTQVELQFGSLRFEVSCIQPEARPARAFASDEVKTAVPYFASSLLSVGALMAAMAFFVPPMGLTDGEDVSQDQLISMQAYLQSAAERELKQEEEKPVPDANQPAGGQEGEAAKGEAGQMGKKDAKVNPNARSARKGPKDNTEPELATVAMAEEFGVIGILNGGMADPDAPNAPWANPLAMGNADVSAQGNMWGDVIDESGGVNGLSLYGVGEYGGERGEHIGLGSVGTWGTVGNCIGAECTNVGPGGIGRSVARSGPGYTPKKPSIRGRVEVSGRVPAHVIQRIIRQNHGRFRLCYEKGLMTNPNLEGRVAVRFMINRDGSVSHSGSVGSTLPDSGVVNCVVRTFYGLSFPKPEGGTVSVSYPIMFSPG